jgi:class 3 adenylate cyclase/tetratricopeptide (TPR) repeat protein
MSDGRTPPFDLAAWLTGLGLAQYIGKFTDNDVDAGVLDMLTAEDLRELGVVSVGHRRRLLDAIARRHAQTPPAEAASEGSPVAATPAAATAGEGPQVQRRQLTVMFCDLIGSTELSVRVDPEDFREFVTAYRAALKDVVEAHNGQIAQYLGDGILAYFGYPHAQGHDAENAVRAGLAVIERIAALPPFGGQQPQVRIGIATGMTVVSRPDRFGEMLGESTVGETPNLAARVQSVADANSVVIAPATRHLIGEMFACQPLGAFDLKGFAEPIRLWRVEHENRAGSRFEALRSDHRPGPFVGREGELGRLGGRFAAAQRGHGQLVVVSGEGGMGKSRLVRAFLDAVAPDTHGRLLLQCSPYQSGMPFQPIRYHIERACGIRPADSGDEAARKLTGLLSRSGPVTAETLAVIAELLRLDSFDKAPLAAINAQILRGLTMKTLLTLVENFATRASAIVIEDIQWIDPSTAELIGNLVPMLRRLPVLLIATMRPGPLPAWIDAAQARVIALERLYPDEARRLVEATAGPERLAESVIGTIIQRSDGVPLFIEELTRGYLEAAAQDAARAGAIAEGSDPSGDLSRIPLTLAESLLAQLDGLGASRDIASMAAAIGREFPVAVLTAIANRPEEEVAARVQELLDAGVLVIGHSSFGRAIAFRHALVRDAAYQLLLRRDRSALHARIAEMLRTRFPTIAEALPQVMAMHLRDAGDHREAAAQWERAGLDATRRSAYAEAISHFDQAIEAIGKLPHDQERDQRELALRLNRVGPLLAAFGYGAPNVVQEIDATLALSRRLGTGGSFVLALASKWLVLGNVGNFAASYELALQMRDIAAEGSEIDRLVAHRTLGTTLMFRGEFRDAICEFEHFLALYDRERHGGELSRIGPSNHHIVTLLGLAESYTILGQAAHAERWRAKCIELARALGESHVLSHTLVFAGCVVPLLERRMEEIALNVAELNRLVTVHDLVFWRGHADLFAGIVLAWQGQTEEGIVQARRGIDRLIEVKAYSNVWYIFFAELCEQAGHHADGAAVLAMAAPALAEGDAWLAAEFYRVRGRLMLALGEDVQAARRDLETAVATARKQSAVLFEARALAALHAISRPEGNVATTPAEVGDAGAASAG